MQIKDLTHEYLDSFYELFRNIMLKDFPEYKSETLQYFLNTLYSKNHFYSFINSPYRKNLVIEEDDEIIGFLVADQTFGGVGFISWLGIKDGYRNNGLASKILEEYKNFCKSKDAHLIEVYTFPKTVEFYKRKGFMEVGRREKGYFGVVNIIMDKNI